MLSKTRLIYADSAVSDLKNLDKKTAKRIVEKIDANSTQADPLSNAKALTGEYKGYYRYRIGDCRVIFKHEKNKKIVVLMALKIGHRKNIYK